MQEQINEKTKELTNLVTKLQEGLDKAATTDALNQQFEKLAKALTSKDVELQQPMEDFHQALKTYIKGMATVEFFNLMEKFKESPKQKI